MDLENTSPIFSVTDFLQLAGMNTCSVLFEISRGEDYLGQIRLYNGVVVAASDLHGEGIDAFQRLVLEEQTKVTYGSPQTEPGDKALGSVDSLLLSAFTANDQEQHRQQRAAMTPKYGSGGPPPLPPEIFDIKPAERASPRSSQLIPPLPEVKIRRSSVPNRVRGVSSTDPMPSPVLQPRSVGEPQSIAPNQKYVSALQKILSELRDCDRGAIVNAQGLVRHNQNTTEADVLGAVVTMAVKQLQSVTSSLSLGPLHGWCFVSETNAWFVVPVRDLFFALCGPKTKNPAVVLQQITTGLAHLDPSLVR